MKYFLQFEQMQKPAHCLHPILADNNLFILLCGMQD